MRPWNKKTALPPWMEPTPQFGATRHHDKRYNTRQWQKVRKIKMQANPLCEMCQRKGITRAADMVDHIQTVREGGDFFDMVNLQSLCKHCHRVKTNREIRQRS